MTFDAIVDKIAPAITVAIIMAVFGMYMRVGSLEYVAESAVARYVEDKREMRLHIKELQTENRLLRDRIIVLENK
jgi:Uri superfamily endonuclease